MLRKTSLLGVFITISSKTDILDFFKKKLSTVHPLSSLIQIVTPNPEQIVLAQTDGEFRRILNEADITLPDGAGVVWALRQMPNDKCQMTNMKRISGVDFMEDLCRLAGEMKKRVLFYGGRGGTAGKALTALKKQYPELEGIAEDGGEFQMTPLRSASFEGQANKSPSFAEASAGRQNSKTQTQDEPVSIQAEAERLIRIIRSRNISIVFIGLGAPKQEYLMDTLSHTFKGDTLHGVYSNLILMVVGGAFDMLAGKVARAPKGVQTIGFEWLWRLIQEPWRWKRQWNLIEFMRLVIFRKILDN